MVGHKSKVDILKINWHLIDGAYITRCKILSYHHTWNLGFYRYVKTRYPCEKRLHNRSGRQPKHALFSCSDCSLYTFQKSHFEMKFSCYESCCCNPVTRNFQFVGRLVGSRKQTNKSILSAITIRGEQKQTAPTEWLKFSFI